MNELEWVGFVFGTVLLGCAGLTVLLSALFAMTAMLQDIFGWTMNSFRRVIYKTKRAVRGQDWWLVAGVVLVSMMITVSSVAIIVVAVLMAVYGG